MSCIHYTPEYNVALTVSVLLPSKGARQAPLSACVHRGLAFRCQSVTLMGAPHMFSLLPASPSIPSLTEMVSVTAPCHKHIPPTGTVRRGVSWSRFRNKTAYSATARTTSNAILCCLSFSYSDNLASSRPSSPKQPDR